jgi:hypothetical protein
LYGNTRSNPVEGIRRTRVRIRADLYEQFRHIAAAHRREIWVEDGARDMAQWLAAELGISSWKARRWLEASLALE